MQNAVPQGLSSSIFTTEPARRRAVPGGGRFGLRHRQRQHRHLRRRDRRRLRRREGNRRWPRIGLGCVEGLHAPADQHHQLLRRAAAGAGHQVRPLMTCPTIVPDASGHERRASSRPAPGDRQPGLGHPRLDAAALARQHRRDHHRAHGPRRDPRGMPKPWKATAWPSPAWCSAGPWSSSASSTCCWSYCSSAASPCCSAGWACPASLN